jgi:hypothetical protein
VPLELDVAVRGLAVRPNRRQRRSRRFGKELGHSQWSLIFDTETTTGLGQRLRVGCYRLYRGSRLRKCGLFADRDALEPDEVALVEAYAREQGLRLLSREQFVRWIFFGYGWERRALIIGANLGYDISQLAIDHCPAKDPSGFMRGGFSFTLDPDPRLPRVQVKRLGARATTFRFTIPSGRSPEARNKERGGTAAPHRGYFLDVLGLGAALFGRKFTLKKLAEELGTKHRKVDSEEHGARITREYLQYLKRDVLVTWECAEALGEHYEGFGFTQTPVTRIYSEASIGKALLTEAGAQPWLQLQHDLPESVLASILETYYGGRSECHIRRLPVPGAYLDFLSQYPTVFVLQELDRYLFGQGFDWQEEDPWPTQQLLDRIQPEDVLDRALWPTLDAICLVAPEGALLPTRARYRAATTADGSRAYNLALAYRHGGPVQWWTLADLIASKLEAGHAPKLLRVIRFQPRRRQTGLRPVELNGDVRYRVDPNGDDLIKRLVELRQELKADAAAAAVGRRPDQARLLKGLARGVKIQANAIAYGIPIEFNVNEHRRPIDLAVELPDGDRYTCKNRRVEAPGRWFNPLITTLVSSGGRLLLATAIALLHRIGGEYAICDTDSLFVVATRNGGLIPCHGGPHQLEDGQEAIKALGHHALLHQFIDRFKPLNPYDRSLGERSILELEPENFEPESGEQIEISCISLAAKRYALYTVEQNRMPRLVGTQDKRHRSEHGLGHLLLPTDPEHGTGPALDAIWEHLIASELGVDHSELGFFDQPAIGRLSITSQPDQNAFKTYNRDKPYREQVRPWHFLAVAQPNPLERARNQIRCLIGPYRKDLAKLAEQEWIDRGSPDRRYRLRFDNPLEVDDETIAAQTLRDYIDEYSRHADAKMVGPDGERCHPWTRGLLQHHRITAIGLIRIGKEANPLLDTNDPTPDGPTIEYPTRTCRGCSEPLTGRRRTWCTEACRKRFERRAASSRLPPPAHQGARRVSSTPPAPRCQLPEVVRPRPP